MEATKLKKAQLAARMNGTVIAQDQADFWRTKPGLVPVDIKGAVSIGTKRDITEANVDSKKSYKVPIKYFNY